MVYNLIILYLYLKHIFLKFFYSFLCPLKDFLLLNFKVFIYYVRLFLYNITYFIIICTLFYYYFFFKHFNINNNLYVSFIYFIFIPLDALLYIFIQRKRLYLFKEPSKGDNIFKNVIFFFVIIRYYLLNLIKLQPYLFWFFLSIFNFSLFTYILHKIIFTKHKTKMSILFYDFLLLFINKPVYLKKTNYYLPFHLNLLYKFRYDYRILLFLYDLNFIKFIFIKICYYFEKLYFLFLNLLGNIGYFIFNICYFSLKLILRLLFILYSFFVYIKIILYLLLKWHYIFIMLFFSIILYLFIYVNFKLLFIILLIILYFL